MRAFKTFDVNGDNFITLTELSALLQKVRFISGYFLLYISIVFHFRINKNGTK